MKRLHKKRQAMVEFILVMGLYFFFIGFMISSFQIMHNKMIINMAAYEATRGAIALDPVTGTWDDSDGVANAQSILTHAIGFKNAKVSGSASGNYVTYTVSGTVKYLFPIINTNGIGSSKSLDIDTSFTMRKEKKN